MPRNCGCASASCTCLLVSSDGSIEINGAGSTANPYDLSAANISLENRFQIQDTQTVDLTLTGNGSAASPFVLSATATIELGELTNVDASGGATGDVVAQQPDGSFGLNPPSTAPVGVIMSDDSIDGDGSASDPLSVHDYDRIAWLAGADNLPNEGNLRLGLPSVISDYGYYISREQSGGSGATAYTSQQDHRIGARVGTSLLSDADEGPIGSGGLVLRAQDVLHIPGQSAELVLYQTGHLARIHDNSGVTQASYIPYAMYSERVLIQGDGNQSASVSITFPSGYFTEVPTVVGSLDNTGTGTAIPYIVRFQDLSTAGCEVILQRPDGGTFTSLHGVGVQAMQMDPP